MRWKIQSVILAMDY